MNKVSHRLCTAPMMDCSDRHCRFFFRQLAPHARLYTEMVTAAALLRGDTERHLRFDPVEHPVALQLGGSDPDELAVCARLGADWGYDEINLNCGCPSERVQRGSFGACLMTEPQLVADCVDAMRSASRLPVTVKHRIGIDACEDYSFAQRFVEQVARAGCATFIVHARNAVLKGLSPKANREVPPLKHDYVYRLKRDFPHLTLVINGGIHNAGQAAVHLKCVDGVMLGRVAYHNPYALAELDARLFSADTPTREVIVSRMVRYSGRAIDEGQPLRAVARHMLGLFHGQPRARLWRQMLSDPMRLETQDPTLLLDALAATQVSAPATAVTQRRSYTRFGPGSLRG